MITIEIITDSLFPGTPSGHSGILESSIFSDARSDRGFDYFWSVDRGRRGFSAINGKALKIPIGGGKFIFRKSVGPARPRYITQRALATASQAATVAASGAQGPTLHDWLKSFLNNFAAIETQAFRAATPVVSGKLASKYRVEPAS